MHDPTGVLAIWHDIEPAHEKAVLDWYDREHHFERLGVAGFRRARRFASIDAGPRLFIFYDVDQPEVLNSDAYLARLNNPTPWTRSMMPRFLNNARTACRIVHRAGAGEGGFVATIRLSAREGGATSLETALTDRIFPAVRERELIVSTDLWMSSAGITGVRSREKEIRVVPDQVDNWIIVVGATDPDALASLLDSDLGAPALTEAGAGTGMLVGRYQLQFAANNIS